MRSPFFLGIFGWALAAFALGDEVKSTTSPDVTQSRPAAPIIATVDAIGSRTPDGKLQRFVDSANREFEVHYDSEGRISSVEAVRGRHASDIRHVTYGSNGRILEVFLGNGYTLSFAYADDQTQIIRDRFGGVITRKTTGLVPSDAVLHSDPSGKLQIAVAGLDRLIAATAQ